ncbi:MAG: endonuclease III [Mariprofundaceae bacterium]|nr:endonuclease III [Mariprofundaceae bacterium]
MNKHIQTIFHTFQQQNPEPKTELIYHNVFELLISVILSAQATDISVNKATKALYKIASTPKQMLSLGEEPLKKHISSIGLYHSKAKYIIQTSQRLIEHFSSQVPSNSTDLQSLAGVGQKTANVVLNVFFNQPTMAVDTHVFRVSNRMNLAQGTTPQAVEKGLLKNIPDTYLLHAHHWLILHGRYVCKARDPQCLNCPVSQYCDWKKISQ